MPRNKAGYGSKTGALNPPKIDTGRKTTKSLAKVRKGALGGPKPGAGHNWNYEKSNQPGPG